MGLVKTRRLAAMQKQHRAKAGMKLPMKGDIRRITNRSTMVAMREAERIADDPSVPAHSTRESLVRSLEA